MKAKFLFSALLMISVLGLKAQDVTHSGNATIEGKVVLADGESSFVTNSSHPAIYNSANASLSFPFNQWGNLIIQGRSSSPRSLVFVNGTTPSIQMILSSEGRLGIGVTAPTYKLEVDGNVKFNNYLEIDASGDDRALRINSVEPFIDLRSGGDVNKRLYIKANTISNQAVYNTTLLRHYFNTDVEANGLLTVKAGDINTTSLTSNSGDLTLAAGSDDIWLKTGGSGSEVVGFVDGAGNIKAQIDMETGRFGIGTTTPGAGLDVNHDDGIKVATPSYTQGAILKMVDGYNEGSSAKDDLLVESDGSILFKLDDNANGISGTYQGFAVLDKNDQSVFYATENGKVGIGTTNPGASLQVQGNTAFNGGAYGSADMTLRATNSSYGFIIKGNSTRMFSVLDNSDNDQFMVGSNGNVGIGTGDPSEALDVVGNIEINGTSEFTGKMTVDNDIITKKLRVTADPTAVPDYVFQPGYDLKSLVEIEAYIKANSHLPGIASATEIGANGQDVGAMQLNLLEKIEELTLYTIDQEKKIETQNLENKELKVKNKVLEDTLSELLKRVEKLENKDKTSNDQ